MSIEKYNQKRNFEKTNEPIGKLSKNHSHVFIVQKHAASRLHYDFRLEMFGALKSWAVPKGPSLDPSLKRLAVHVEDHPLDYATFEGNIPAGEYGGGAVMLWDRGTWSSEEDYLKGYHKGHISFELHGEKLKGIWSLIQIKSDPKNWLLIKGKDEFAQAEANYNITDKLSLSVKTGRTLDQIRADKPAAQLKPKTTTPPEKKPFLKSKLVSKKPAIQTTFSPQLATLKTQAPQGDQWVHEIKFDGYRLMAYIDDEVRLITRGQQDWTEKFQTVAQALKKFKLKNAVIDGEVVVVDTKGKSSFSLLQQALQEDKQSKFIFYAFDILQLDHQPLIDMPLLARRQILETIFKKTSKSSRILLSEHIQGEGDIVFNQACALGLEGIISKKIDSVYEGRRSKDWLKIKCCQRESFVVIGYTAPKGNRQFFGSLLIGQFNENKALIYCGHVGTGFNTHILNEIFKMMQPLIISQCPLSKIPAQSNVEHWVKPSIQIDVEFAERTSEGILRHPSFKCVNPQSLKKFSAKSTLPKIKRSATAKKETVSSAKDLLTNPDRLLYPTPGITKLELAHYYQTYADKILPHIINRPLMLLRCPQGMNAECFYQKHPTKTQSSTENLLSIDIESKSGIKPYFYIKNLKGLLELVQMSILEIHPWGCKIDKIDRPDRIIFDLDPSPKISWPTLIEAAHLLKKHLTEFGLESFLKLTGGKGLHLVVPISRTATWSQVKDFSHHFAIYMTHLYPKKFIDVASKIQRTDKIFIDYLRNGKGATAVATYSTRAREHATLAIPIRWEDLSLNIKPDAYTLKNYTTLDRSDDPWVNFFKIKQSLPKINFKSD